MRWERVGRQSSSEAEVMLIPQGQMEQCCRLLSWLLSLRRTFHLLLKEKRNRQPMELLYLHAEKSESTARPALAPSCPPCSLPLKGPPCICTQNPILPVLTKGWGKDYKIQTSPTHAPNFPCGSSGQVSAALSVKWSFIHSLNKYPLRPLLGVLGAETHDEQK